MNRFSLHDTTEKAAAWLSSAAASCLDTAVRQKGSAWLIVSGGQSPAPVYSQLGAAFLPWHSITVSLADERLVPRRHADRNEGMICRTLLQGPASSAQWLPIADDTGDPDKSLDTAVQSLARQTSHPDVIILGMGLDGHTLSWFPDAPETATLMSSDAPQVGLNTPSTAPWQRITLGLPLVLRCRHVFLWLGNREKTRCYQSLDASAAEALPVVRLARLLGEALTIVGVSTGHPD